VIKILVYLQVKRWQKNSSFGFVLWLMLWQKPNVLFVRLALSWYATQRLL
jgi:hypothetical protein